MLIGRVGQLCACASLAYAATIAIAAAMKVLTMASFPRLWTLCASRWNCVARMKRSGMRDPGLRYAPSGLRATRVLVRADGGGPDHLGPTLDLLRQIFGEIFGCALLGRQDVEAELLQAVANGGIVDGVAHRLVELAHNRVRRALR